jgi:restriction system protein
MQFEELIFSVLQKMGFRSQMTSVTDDGGIDIVAVLEKPIIGDRYLIQCKRFAQGNLVAAPAVREFYGALTADKKALKGISITTSSLTKRATEFAENLPLELIDGQGLRQLLES